MYQVSITKINIEENETQRNKQTKENCVFGF